MSRHLRLAAAAALGGLAGLPFGVPGLAAPTNVEIAVHVNTTLDIPGNASGPTAPDCNNPCSLRKAIQFADSQDDSPGQFKTTVITLPAGTYTLTQPPQAESSGNDDSRGGDLRVTRRVRIVGAGAGSTIIRQGLADGIPLDRVFEVTFTAIPGVVTNGRLQISGVTIRDGLVGNATSFNGGDGGGILVTGGASLDLFDSVVTHNFAGGKGGGIADDFGQMTLRDDTISDNGAARFGAGVAVSAPLPVAIYNTTISGNRCGGGCDGGGIYAQTPTTLINDTVDGNTADHGGGYFADSSALQVLDSTLSNNGLNTLDGAAGSALYVNAGGILTVGNTIVAGRSANECFIAPADVVLHHAKGVLISAGSNIDRHNTCGFSQPGDRHSVDPRLGPLAANGGPTRTRAIGPGSPAVDGVVDRVVVVRRKRVTVAGCPPPSLDQRGLPRGTASARSGPRCDIGAFEYQAAAAAVPPLVPTIIETLIPGLPLAGALPIGRNPVRLAWALIALAVLILPALVRAVRTRLIPATPKPRIDIP